MREQTGGSEPSQYPKEKKAIWSGVCQICDSLSSGERNGNSPNQLYVIARVRCITGVVGQHRADTRIGRRVTNLHLNLRILGRITKEGNSPVDEKMQALWMLFPSTAGYTSLWEFGRTIS